MGEVGTTGGRRGQGCGADGHPRGRAERNGPNTLLSPQVVICVDCMYWSKEMVEGVTRGVLTQYSEH